MEWLLWMSLMRLWSPHPFTMWVYVFLFVAWCCSGKNFLNLDFAFFWSPWKHLIKGYFVKHITLVFTGFLSTLFMNIFPSIVYMTTCTFPHVFATHLSVFCYVFIWLAVKNVIWVIAIVLLYSPCWYFSPFPVSFHNVFCFFTTNNTFYKEILQTYISSPLVMHHYVHFLNVACFPSTFHFLLSKSNWMKLIVRFLTAPTFAVTCI